nr:response regulator transcription factor [Bifidobacterium sp. DSM 109958]
MRVGIIENDRMTASVLRHMLGRSDDIHVVWVAATAVEGLRCCFRRDDAQPDVVLVDIMLEGVSGLDVCREIRRRSGTIGVVCITAYEVGPFVDRAVRSGAQAIVSKDGSIEELLRVMRAVARGDAMPPCSTATESHGLVSADDGATPPVALSSMELAVMRGYHRGFSTREMARQHHIAPSTVLVHAHHVMAKLGVHTRVEAVRICLRDHLI